MPWPRSKQIIVKIIPTCNIACTYCYQTIYDHQNWEQLPKGISLDDLERSVGEAFQHAKRNSQDHVNLVFQGGEPLLVGPRRLERIFTTVRQIADNLSLEATLSILTDGTLLNDVWFGLLKKYRVGLCISIDGDRNAHDQHRIDFDGNGTYELVAANVRHAIVEGLKPRALAVVNPRADGKRAMKCLLELGFRSIGFILPAYNYEHQDFQYFDYELGYAKFLIEAFDEWLDNC
jgi:uncharacterized protein